MKRSALIALILVILFSGLVSANVGEKVEWKEAPPLAPWTVLFSYKTSSSGTFGEIIIAENSEEKTPKLFGTTIYSNCKSGSDRETYFFEALYIADEKPDTFIELIKRGKGKYPSVIQKRELRSVVESIRTEEEWIILYDDTIRESPF